MEYWPVKWNTKKRKRNAFCKRILFANSKAYVRHLRFSPVYLLSGLLEQKVSLNGRSSYTVWNEFNAIMSISYPVKWIKHIYVVTFVFHLVYFSLVKRFEIQLTGVLMLLIGLFSQEIKLRISNSALKFHNKNILNQWQTSLFSWKFCLNQFHSLLM